MTKVMVKNGNVEGALRNLKVDKDGSRRKQKERLQGYQKPGVKKRIAKKEGIKNTRKRERMSRRNDR
ncbi:MAG: 30S ribosomal protein S21 [Bacilli bacterium]|nr:30S ribosomal protein S21 [Bacilli bacterium]